MILVDTSVWVDYDRANRSAAERRLTEFIGSGGSQIATCDPVLMEVLAGAKDERRCNDLRRLLTSFGWVPIDPIADFEGASGVYRLCRRNGVTPRGLIDCMIANIALRTGSSLLTSAKDSRAIARVVNLKLA